MLMAAVVSTSTVQSVRLSPDDLAEFPLFDSGARRTLATGLERKELRRRLAETPDDPDLARLLADREGLEEEALRLLRRIAEAHPDRIAPAFRSFPTYRFTMDRTKPHAQGLQEIVALATTKLAKLPREDAARAAFALLPIATQLEPGGNKAWEPKLRALISEYAGTESAVRAEVSLIGVGRVTAATLTAYDDFARAHAGTCAAGSAVYAKLSYLAHNDPARQSDPTARFQTVLDGVRQLEQNGLQKCEGLGNVSDLVVRFYAYQPTFSSEANIDAMIEGYAAFVRTHFVLDAANLADNGIGYVVTRKMADLYAQRGGRVTGVERLLSELEAVAAQRGAARLLRAWFYMRLMADPPSKESLDRAILRDKAIGVLRALHAERSEPFSRRALATLASFYFYERDYTSARTIYQEYLKRYPSSPWAWLATFRLGETELELDNLPAAAAAFERCALSDGPAAPLARVVGGVNASNTYGALGRAADAVERLRRAASAWDDDFGPWQQVRTSQAPGPRDETFRLAETTAETTIHRESLPGRLASLEESARSRGGGSLERGRWLVHRARFDDARVAFERSRAESRGTPFESRARSWLHRAQLERALELATLENPRRDEANAIRELDHLGRASLDFNVTAARIARATIASSVGKTADADAMMTAALDAWRKGQPRGASPAPGLDADVYAIRSAIFLPLGGGIYASAKGRWNAFTWPARLPTFLLVNPAVTVKLSTGERTRVVLRQPIDGFDNVLYVDEEGLALLTRIMTTLGGTRRREPVQPMETPNQPIGRSLDVRAFWDRFFPTRPGHWSGWEFEAYPQITEVAFADPERTRAFAQVTVGYSGATVVLVKQAGVWKAVELTNFWIT